MKTYSETRGHTKLNWFKELSVDCKKMDLDKANRLDDLAQSWITCASGNQCYILDRDEDGRPTDKLLKKLGANFYNEGVEEMVVCINEGDYTLANKHRKKAIKYLEKIESRSRVLILKKINELKEAVKNS